MKLAPSMEPVDENAQHDPHCPWSFTLVTAPWSIQLTLALRLFSLSLLAFNAGVCLYPVSFASSSSVQSLNLLIPTVEVAPFEVLCSATLARLFLNYSALNVNSALVPYDFPNSLTNYMNL